MDTSIRVGVLGPLRAWRGPHEIALGPPQQRAVLAALLLRHGSVLSLSELIEGVWGAVAPASAAGIVRTYLSRLRRLLNPAVGGAPVLTSADHGYRVELGSGGLDLDTFRDLLAQAEHARRIADLTTAADQFQAALALWSGDPLDGVPGPGADRQRALLEQSRRIAITAAFEVDLDLGRHAQALPELRSLAAQDRLDERLQELLMIALYGCGRAGEALDVYRDCRARLRDELGVDPGPGLASLQERIRQADPTLAVTGPPAAVPVPAQLPAAPAAFVGREAALAQALALSTAAEIEGAAPVVAVIGGMAGIGKTTLALHWAHRIAPRFEHGQFYADLRGFDPAREPQSASAVLEGFLQALGVGATAIPADPDLRAAAFRTLIAGRQVLIVLDNARDFEQIRPLLPGAPGCLVIVTSRTTLPGLLVTTGAHYLHLDLLEPDEAHDFLRHRLGRTRVDVEPDAAQTIVERCGRLPLALAITAARAALQPDFTLAAIATELHAMADGINAFNGAEPVVDIRTVFSWSYRALSPGAARAFRLLALHPGPDISVPAAAGLLGVRPADARRAIAELTAARLLLEHVPGRFTLHDLLRAYGAELADEHETPVERRKVVQRMLQYYVHVAVDCAMQIAPPRVRIAVDPPVPEPAAVDRDPTTWFRAEYLVLLALVELAAAESFDVPTWQLAWSMRDYLNRHGLWDNLMVVQRFGLAATRRLGDRVAEARLLQDAALMNINLGDFALAEERLAWAAATFDQAGDEVSSTEVRRQMGWILDGQGDHAGALARSQRALEFYRATGDRARQAPVLNSISWSYSQMSCYVEALDHAQQSLALVEGLGPYLEADTWHSLGYAQHGLGQYLDAIASYRHGLDLYRGLAMHHHAAETLISLSETYQAAGAAGTADRTYAEALTVLDQADHPLAVRWRAQLEDRR